MLLDDSVVSCFTFKCFFWTPLAARCPLSVARSCFCSHSGRYSESMLPAVTRAGSTMKLRRGGSPAFSGRLREIHLGCGPSFLSVGSIALCHARGLLTPVFFPMPPAIPAECPPPYPHPDQSAVSTAGRAAEVGGGLNNLLWLIQPPLPSGCLK